MAYVELRGKLGGMLMHRNPGDQPSKEKAPRGAKTQSWIDKQHKEDWIQSAYWDENEKCFHVPPEVIEAALATAARKIRMGKSFQASVSVEDVFVPLYIYSGPEDQKGQKANGGKLEDWYKAPYIDLRSVGIQASRVDRCRPRFPHWGIKFTLIYEEDVVSPDQLQKACANAIIGDFRPRFGRVALTKFESVNL